MGLDCSFFGNSCAYEYPNIIKTRDMQLIQQANDFLNGPNMIGNPRLHGRCDAKSLMDSSEIVKHEMQGHGMGLVLDLFAKRIG